MSSGEESSPAAEEQVKYKGVRKRKWGKYVTEIRLSNSRERIWLGSYDTAEKAARAFDAALLCLRGPHAKFNFPDDPPSFAAAPGMSPAEIQSIAQQYANRFPTHRAEEEEEEEEEKAENSKETMDWSFLGDFDLGKRSGISGISDFELFHDPEGMNTPTYFGLPHYRNYDDTDDE